MYECMYVCTCFQAFVCIHVCICVCVYACVHTCVYVLMHMCICVCFAHACVCLYACMCVCMFACARVFTCVCVCTRSCTDSLWKDLKMAAAAFIEAEGDFVVKVTRKKPVPPHGILFHTLHFKLWIRLIWGHNSKKGDKVRGRHTQARKRPAWPALPRGEAGSRATALHPDAAALARSVLCVFKETLRSLE